MTVSCKHLSIIKGDHQILTDINFFLDTGSFLALVGPNGSGKTTLLRCLAGAESKYSGTIDYGQKVLGKKRPSRPRTLVAYVPEDTSPPFGYSALDIVIMGRFPYHRGTPTAADRKIALDALAKVGLASIKDQSITSMSTGEKRKTMLARALASQADVMILDELVANLDVLGQLEVIEILKNLCADEKKIVILSIHDLSLAKQASNQCLVLKNSLQLAFGDTASVLTPTLITGTFGVRAEDVTNSQGTVGLSFYL